MHPARTIEIVGGGLAGLSLGIALRRAGVPVTVHEAGDYPRHRACGEFITGLAPDTIARLDLGSSLADALVHHQVAWFLPGQRPRIQRLPAPALGISRHTLDARLAERFLALGGELHRKSRVNVEERKSGRVVACGRRRAPRSRWIGLKVHVNNLSLFRELELHLGEGGYVGLAQIEDGRVNICGLFKRRPLSAPGPDLLKRYLQATGLTELATRIENATVLEDSFCAVAAVEFDRRVGTTSEIRLGDAAAMIPPFTGNGMAMAFQSAELALPPLLAYADGVGDWRTTCAVTNTALRNQFRLRLASADVLHPLLIGRHAQRWLAALNRARLLPFRVLYSALH